MKIGHDLCNDLIESPKSDQIISKENRKGFKSQHICSFSYDLKLFYGLFKPETCFLGCKYNSLFILVNIVLTEFWSCQ